MPGAVSSALRFMRDLNSLSLFLSFKSFISISPLLSLSVSISRKPEMIRREIETGSIRRAETAPRCTLFIYLLFFSNINVTNIAH